MLFNFLDKNHTTLYAFVSSGRNLGRLVYPTCRFALRRAVCRLPLRGVGCRSITSKQSSLNSTCKSKHNFAHFDRMAVFFRLQAQKHLARGRASASPRVNRVKSFSPCKGKSVPVCHLFGERLLSFCISQHRLSFRKQII